MEPIRVLYCIDALPKGGGTENQLGGLIERLDRRIVAPHLCTLQTLMLPAYPVDCPRLDLDVGSLAAPRSVSGYRRLFAYLKRERIDVVQTFFQDATLVGGVTARLAGVPVRIASFRDLGFWRTPAQEFWLRRVHPSFTGFLANSQAVKDHFCGRDGLSAAAVTVIPNGLDTAGISFVEHVGPVRRIGIVGNLNRPVKRIDLFVQAAGRVAENYPEIGWQVLGDGYLRAQLVDQARRLGLEGRIDFAGNVDDVIDRLGDWQVGVLCSDSEGFSNALLEYMLRGCAAVATDVGGNREAVRDGETGLLVPADDAGALAAALERLIADDALRRRLAAAARRSVAREYSWENCVQRHQEYYIDAVREAGGARNRGR